MKIGTKIALQFTFIVGIILAIFSFSLYYLLESYTKKEFSKYLTDRAQTTASNLIKVKNLDKRLLKILDRNTLNSLYDAQVLVFDDDNKVTYSNLEKDSIIYYNPDLLSEIRKEKYLIKEYSEKMVVGLMYTDDIKKKEFLILAQSEDRYGNQKLENIKYAMTTGLISAIFLTILLGFIFSNQTLKPISKMNSEISKITARNLGRKLSVSKNNDEISSLAHNFNEMLSRLEKSFMQQKSFVSNASHELRTPLAAIKSEIQVALEKDRSTEEYKNVLSSLEKDNFRLVKLTNGLLQLAKSEEGTDSLPQELLRIDEILFQVQDDLHHQNPDFQIEIDFDSIPEDDSYLSLMGNKSLMNTLFINIIENACKYSPDHKAAIIIKYNSNNCIIKISDKGIGILPEEIDRIFEPFFRTQNTGKISGHGIGLSICKKIVESHKGRISVKSDINKGSTFTVVLPHISVQ
jgi:two-component system, OmpR family, sensor histidine kinase ArlS